MAWKDKKAEAWYKEARKDPEFVEKKRRYLNEWYKKNRTKQLKLWAERRRKYPKKVREIQRRAHVKYRDKLRSAGLSQQGNPLLTQEERYMLLAFLGFMYSHSVPKKLRVKYAKKGAAVAIKNRKKKIAAAVKKYGVGRLMRLKRKIHG